MAHEHHTPTGGHPAMDYKSHEDTYKGFMHFTEVAVVAILAIVVALAVGGVKHAWFAASLGTILSLVTCGIGLAAPSIGWRAPLVALVIMLLALVLL
jgi:Bacterial aa3 type cytochrome c oxidase subunit IV